MVVWWFLILGDAKYEFSKTKKHFLVFGNSYSIDVDNPLLYHFPKAIFHFLLPTHQVLSVVTVDEANPILT